MSPFTLGRFVLALTLAGMVGGCFRPLYGDQSSVGGPRVLDKMQSIEVDPVKATGDRRIARVAGEVRNEVIFALTGGGPTNTSSYRLVISFGSQNQQVIADVATGRSDGGTYGINASYSLIEVGTGKQVFNGSTFSRVSYDLPGQMQRFAGERALRDAENRAAKVIAGNIQTRLASYFAAGT
jgi:LPS-assembly lipoprotein